MDQELLKDNEKLISEFGVEPISKLKKIPNFYTFKKGLIYSHRDFDKFYNALKKGKKCAILSGFNASGTIHLGHKIIFDMNLYFQKEFDIPVFIPISDDESYVTGKVKTQEEALRNSKQLVKELLAYGFNPKKTYFIIDQIYTNIYNLAIKLSKRVTLSEIKATYGYKNEDNPGLYFYPTVQAAHILLPQEKFGIKYILVPIGPDEDAHLRICRDLAERFDYNKPAVLHAIFLLGLDGKKMSKSRDNAIFLKENPNEIMRKVKKAFSGGQPTVEEHKEKGGNPEIDMSCQYLSKFFLTEEESKKLFSDYKTGKLLSGDVKKMLAKKLIKFTRDFQDRLSNITDEDVEKVILRNEF